MPAASIKKNIPCSKEEIIEMVLDIEKYPEFVPWCIGSKIHSKLEMRISGNIEIIADLTIGKSFFKDTYKSFVIYNKSEDTIRVTNMDGPLKYLENNWFFTQDDETSKIEFHVDFELKNTILNILMIKYFDFGLKRIGDAFEKRAIQLFKKT